MTVLEASVRRIVWRLLGIYVAAQSGSAATITGPEACRECHPKQAQSQMVSHHANALRRMNDTRFADLLSGQTMRERNGAAFEYRKTSKGVEVSVTKGNDQVTALLEWAFGAGHQAYTAVGRTGGAYFEHRISWYRERGGLGLTPGHSPQPSVDANSAVGLVQSEGNARRCFGCHATGSDRPETLLPGVTCERCHGAGSVHIAAARAGKSTLNTILDARKLSASASVAVCSQCHRSPNREFTSEMPELDDPASIRFAPVGFQASACFRASKSFTCVSCHNPHENAKPAGDNSYTVVCLNCHADAPANRVTCRENCVSCHMKKSSPLPYLTFTDHRIRVALE